VRHSDSGAQSEREPVIAPQIASHVERWSGDGSGSQVLDVNGANATSFASGTERTTNYAGLQPTLRTTA